MRSHESASIIKFCIIYKKRDENRSSHGDLKNNISTNTVLFLGKDAGAVGGLSSGLYDDARGETKGEVINIVQDKDGKGGGGGNEGTFTIMFHYLKNIAFHLILKHYQYCQNEPNNNNDFLFRS